MTRSPSLVSVRVVSGPTTEPAPTSLPPRRLVPGSIRASAAISTSASTQVEAGSTTVTPASMWRLEDAAACLGLDGGEVGPIVDSHRHREVVGEVGGDGVARLAQGREDVGQVVLALGVVVGESGEGAGQRRLRRRRRCRR